MEALQIVFMIIMLIAAVFLVVAVLMQHGKSHGLSGTIAGGAENFFGKEKGKAIDKKLAKLTAIVAIVFVVLTLVAFVIQDQTNYDALLDFLEQQATATTPVATTPVETTPVVTTPAAQ